jgi:hypothetical protein
MRRSGGGRVRRAAGEGRSAYRVNVALVCFVLGALFTVELASSGQMWAPSAVAALVGVMTLRRTIRQTRVN